MFSVRLAIDVFCYRARKYIGAYLAAMGGADAVVFTGSIGENFPEVRTSICADMEWTGLRLDQQKNQEMIGHEGKISTDNSKLLAYAIPPMRNSSWSAIPYASSWACRTRLKIGYYCRGSRHNSLQSIPCFRLTQK